MNDKNILSDDRIRELCETAVEMRNKSYTPYSHFRVGAALLAENGRIYTGCNIENAAYTPGCCAERTAFFKAVSDGQTHFTAIAIAGGPENGELQYCPPCGVCRQVMTEFCEHDFVVFLAKSADDYRRTTLNDILPFRFGPSNLDDKKV